MFEKVNPSHPDKVADRIAGAIVDLCYTKSRDPKVACEVLIGHGECNIQVETSERIGAEDIGAIVSRIAGEGIETRALIVPQDIHLAANQQHGVKCGDNGIFRGVPPTYEQKLLTAIAASIYERHPTDGKYLVGDANAIVSMGRDGRLIVDATESRIKCLDNLKTLTICQSHASNDEIDEIIRDFFMKNGGKHPTGNDEYINKETGLMIKTTAAFLKGKWYAWGNTINPLGPWTGGINVDCGCTNRKLGSDMGDGVTGGGLMGKDLSKADVSVNIVCYLKAVASGQVVTATCSIGDEDVTFVYADGTQETERFADIVEQARLYIMTDCGGSFERFAEWGLVRANTD